MLWAYICLLAEAVTKWRGEVCNFSMLKTSRCYCLRGTHGRASDWYKVRLLTDHLVYKDEKLIKYPCCLNLHLNICDTNSTERKEKKSNSIQFTVWLLPSRLLLVVRFNSTVVVVVVNVTQRHRLGETFLSLLCPTLSPWDYGKALSRRDHLIYLRSITNYTVPSLHTHLATGSVWRSSRNQRSWCATASQAHS